MAFTGSLTAVSHPRPNRTVSATLQSFTAENMSGLSRKSWTAALRFRWGSKRKPESHEADDLEDAMMLVPLTSQAARDMQVSGYEDGRRWHQKAEPMLEPESLEYALKHLPVCGYYPKLPEQENDGLRWPSPYTQDPTSVIGAADAEAVRIPSVETPVSSTVTVEAGHLRDEENTGIIKTKRPLFSLRRLSSTFSRSLDKTSL